jgi:hypothetical protein
VSNTGHRKSRLGAGDYWPGEAENLLSSISEEARQAGKKGKKAGGSGKGAVRPGKKGKRYGATGTTDEQLMGKLGETVQGMKEDFIVVHLQEPCSFCRCYISDENRCCMQPPRLPISRAPAPWTRTHAFRMFVIEFPWLAKPFAKNSSAAAPKDLLHYRTAHTRLPGFIQHWLV